MPAPLTGKIVPKDETFAELNAAGWRITHQILGAIRRNKASVVGRKRRE